MLATSLHNHVRSRGDSSGWTFLTQADLDITEPQTVRRTFDELQPSWVVNASGFTNVDGAESNAEAARLLNGSAVGDIAHACHERGARLVHYSTDYVFNGESDRPWREDDPVGPLNIYGQSKLEGELAVRASGVEHLIVRSSWLYAAHGRNFVRTILDRLRSNGRVRVINDQRGRPTCCDDLAAMTLELMGSPFRGTVHATNDGEATWYEFACVIRDFGAPNGAVEACTTADYPTPAARPRYSTLDLTRLKSILSRRPRSWQEALADVVAALLQES
jgi:dTDP-4-dehydrorhamnose reductase